jgi:hypothetical protein
VSKHKEVREVRSIGYIHEGPSPKERAAQRFLQELRVLAGCLLPGMTPEQIAAAVHRSMKQEPQTPLEGSQILCTSLAAGWAKGPRSS